jgi:peptide/nickel transport system permease protein
MSDVAVTERPGETTRRPPETYWAIVRHQFAKNRSAVAGLWLVFVFFFAAVFAPFLANSKPFYLFDHGRLSFPLFANLTPADLVIFAAAGCALLWWIAGRVAPRGWFHGHPWFGTFIVFAAIFVVLSFVIELTVGERNDRIDYRALAAKPGVSAMFAPIRYSPIETDLAIRRTPPFRLPGHFLGTDDLGRDVASRLLWATRVSLAVGFIAEGCAVVIGVTLGAIAGYFGRKVDFIIMRFVEVMICFPAFFLILTVLAFFGRHLWLIMLVIGITGWTDNARFIRAEFLRLRTLEYAMAARALGLGWVRIVFRHLLPNGIAPVLVNASFGVAAAILIEGGLSFLGFGVAPPRATWGTMLNEGRANILDLPWLIVLPGLAIFLAVSAYNLVGEGLRDALDPKLREA